MDATGKVRRLCFYSLSVMLLGLSACSNSKAKTVAVTGKVLLPDGKPAEHATVVFHPVGTAGVEIVKPRGTVAADGTFKLTTTNADDGAPVGKYQVTVERWLRPSNAVDAAPVNWLPERFAKPETSGFEVTINADSVDVGTFQIKR